MREVPPPTWRTSAVSSAPLTPERRVVDTIASAGIIPVPVLPSSPNSPIWIVSRTLLPSTPAAQQTTGRLNRRPHHHEGYLPVRCAVTSYAALVDLPLRLAPIRARSICSAPAAKKFVCFS